MTEDHGSAQGCGEVQRADAQVAPSPHPAVATVLDLYRAALTFRANATGYLSAEDIEATDNYVRSVVLPALGAEAQRSEPAPQAVAAHKMHQNGEAK